MTVEHARLTSASASASGAADGAVWRALANRHRRTILDALAGGPATTGTLAGAVDGISRYAVMQHLGVLEEAGLVVVRRDGRHRFNYLNAVPIQQAYDRWVRGLNRGAATAAAALARHLSGPTPSTTDTNEQGVTPMGDDKPIRAVRIENEIHLPAAIDRCFAALTTEQAAWYPYNYGGARLKAIVFEPRVGGQCFEDWGDGQGTLYGTVWFYDAPNAYCLRGHLAGGVSLEHWYRFVPVDGGTTMQQSLVAMGPISDDDELGIRTHGDIANVADRLVAYLGG